MHGEYAFSQLGSSSYRGTPPYAWGIRGQFAQLYIKLRYTPICMGNTSVRSLSKVILSVHPHMHGEYPELS